MQCDFNRRILPNVKLGNLRICGISCLVLVNGFGLKPSISADKRLDENANDHHTSRSSDTCWHVDTFVDPSGLSALRRLAPRHSAAMR